MSTLSQAYLNLTVDASTFEVEVVRKYLLEIARRYATDVYEQDVEIEVRVEQGSLKAWIKVGGLISAAVITYGGLRTGIDYLVRDARKFDESVISRFIEDAQIEDDKIYRVERRLGIPGRIRRLLIKIDKIQGADYTNSIVHKGLEELRDEVQGIVDDLDSSEDRQEFVSNLPKVYQGINPTTPRLPEPPYKPMPMLRPTVANDYETDGTLTDFADKYGHRLQITHKK